VFFIWDRTDLDFTLELIEPNGATMGYADLTSSKVARLPVDRQAEVLRYVEAVEGEPSARGQHLPDQADDGQRSLRTGQIVHIDTLQNISR